MLFRSHLLDNDLFNFSDNEQISQEMFYELRYGLGLITSHLRLLCNHFKANGILELQELEEKYLKKVMRLVNNMCVIMVYFRMVF